MAIGQVAIYAPVKTPVNADWSLSSISGNLPAASYTIQLFNINRAGRTNKDEQTIVLGATGGIRVTLNSTLQTSATDLHAVGIALAGVQIARFEARAFSDEAAIALTSVDITEPEHVVTALTVANQAALPTGANLLNGQIRQVTADAKSYVYRADATSGDVVTSPGYWSQLQSDTGDESYVNLGQIALDSDDISAPGGFARAIGLVSYPKSPPLKTSTDGVPVLLAFANNDVDDSGSDIASGRVLDLAFALNGQFSVLSGGVLTDFSAMFSHLIKVQILGYGAFSDFSLDTVPAVGESVWFPGTSALQFKTAMSRGNYFLAQFKLSFENAQLPVNITAQDTISMTLVDRGTLGLPSPEGAAFGNTIFAGDDFYRIVPNRRLSGKVGFISGAGQDVFYSLRIRSESDLLPFIAANTANQYVMIDGARGGEIRVIQTLSDRLGSEAVRAIVSTATGTASYVVEATTLTLALNDSIVITINHPYNATTGLATVRADYSDTKIAGNAKANLFATKMFIAILDGTSGNVYVRDVADDVTLAASQQITVSSLTGFTSVGASWPTNAGFGLFEPASVTTVAQSSTGSFAAGDYTVRVAYHYDTNNTICTSITHDTTAGVEVAEVEGTIASFLTDPTNLWQRSFTSVANMAGALVSSLNDGATYKVSNPSSNQSFLYTLHKDKAGTADGTNIVALTADTTYKFYLVSGGSSSGGGIWTEVADIAALKLVTVPPTNDWYLVHSESNYPPLLYYYDSAVSTAERSPVIIAPGSGSGRWIASPIKIEEGSGAPGFTPAYRQSFYIDNSTANGLFYQSVWNGSALEWRMIGARNFADLLDTDGTSEVSSAASITLWALHTPSSTFRQTTWTPPDTTGDPAWQLVASISALKLLASPPSITLALVTGEANYFPMAYYFDSSDTSSSEALPSLVVPNSGNSNGVWVQFAVTFQHGAGAPTGTPTNQDYFYIDTTNGDIYAAIDNGAGSRHWVQLNGGSSLTIGDGVTSIADVTNITFTGFNVDGTASAATVTNPNASTATVVELARLAAVEVSADYNLSTSLASSFDEIILFNALTGAENSLGGALQSNGLVLPESGNYFLDTYNGFAGEAGSNFANPSITLNSDIGGELIRINEPSGFSATNLYSGQVVNWFYRGSANELITSRIQGENFSYTSGDSISIGGGTTNGGTRLKALRIPSTFKTSVLALSSNQALAIVSGDQTFTLALAAFDLDDNGFASFSANAVTIANNDLYIIQVVLTTDDTSASNLLTRFEGRIQINGATVAAHQDICDNTNGPLERSICFRWAVKLVATNTISVQIATSATGSESINVLAAKSKVVVTRATGAQITEMKSAAEQTETITGTTGINTFYGATVVDDIGIANTTNGYPTIAASGVYMVNAMGTTNNGTSATTRFHTRLRDAITSAYYCYYRDVFDDSPLTMVHAISWLGVLPTGAAPNLRHTWGGGSSGTARVYPDTTDNGSAIQVIKFPTGVSSDPVFIRDEFTGTNATAMADHTPTESSTGFGWSEITILGATGTAASSNIQGNQLQIADDSNGIIATVSKDIQLGLKWTLHSAGQQEIMVLFRYNDSENYCGVQFRGVTNNDIRLIQRVSGVDTVVGTLAQTIAVSTTNFIRVQVIDSRVLINFNNIVNYLQLPMASLTTFTNAGVARVVGSDDMRIDELEMRSYTINSTASSASAPGSTLDITDGTTSLEDVTQLTLSEGFTLGGSASAATLAGPRRRLTANTTFHFSTTGNDTTGDGTAGNPWATFPKAADVVASLDCSIYQPTIQAAAGTFTMTEQYNLPTCLSSTPILVKGAALSSSDATSIFQHAFSGFMFVANNIPTVWQFEDFGWQANMGGSAFCTFVTITKSTVEFLGTTHVTKGGTGPSTGSMQCFRAESYSLLRFIETPILRIDNFSGLGASGKMFAILTSEGRLQNIEYRLIGTSGGVGSSTPLIDGTRKAMIYANNFTVPGSGSWTGLEYALSEDARLLVSGGNLPGSGTDVDSTSNVT